MFGKQFQLSPETISIVEEIGRHMPGGFFIYKAAAPYELLYANRAVLDIYGCRDLDEFKALTGYSFRGMLHPDDFESVNASIEEQIGREAEEKLDHVEYRIVRRDGAVRWVDDYGHYTETDAYGGVYYVFISDITEKRARRDSDLAARQALIEALSETYSTVWLISDAKTGEFSFYHKGSMTGDPPSELLDASGSMQYDLALEYYLETTVAPSDQARLRVELTRENLVRRLRERPHFSVNFLRRMQDGSEHYFRIEFAKVDMPGKKMGIVCGFKDVDVEVREGRAVQEKLREAEQAKTREAEAKQRELEQRLALQAQLLEEERQRVMQRQLITALASDYRSVYYVELDRNEGVCYQSLAGRDNGLRVGEHFPYLETFAAYADRYVTEAYRDEFLRFIQPDAIREGLREALIISLRYKVRIGDKESYEMLRFAGVRHPEDRDDHIVHAVGAGMTDVDAETRRALEQSRALGEALTAAENASRAKTAFLSSMSHELRTPMNAIIGLDNIALNDPDVPEKTRERLEMIGASAHHLLEILDDVLDMSRIESGHMLLKSERFSFSETLRELNELVGGLCEVKGLRYACETGGRLGESFIGDGPKLRQALGNVLDNAVKFTPAGGSVTLRVDETARFDGKTTLRFIVSDTGIGIDREYLPRLFEPFTQEDASTTSRYGSTGLGLAIAKSIVEQMNGSIAAESEKGRGSTFTITVTLTDAESADPAAAQADNAGAGTKAELSGRRMLVAEDVAINAEILLMVLSMRGIYAELAENGQLAVDMFASHEPGYYDAILMDMRMPVMDGLEATRTIRAMARPDAKTIPIIALTANAFDEDVQRSMQAGLNAHLNKPVVPDVLFETLENLIR